jgi:hypothetical protein
MDLSFRPQVEYKNNLHIKLPSYQILIVFNYTLARLELCIFQNSGQKRNKTNSRLGAGQTLAWMMP